MLIVDLSDMWWTEKTDNRLKYQDFLVMVLIQFNGCGLRVPGFCGVDEQVYHMKATINDVDRHLVVDSSGVAI